MIGNPRLGIDREGNFLKYPKEKRVTRSLSKEKFDKIPKQPFFEPVNKLSSKKENINKSSITLSRRSSLDSIKENRSSLNFTEKKERQAYQKVNQEQTAQNHTKTQNKFADKFNNIVDYITSQSNPSSQNQICNINVKRTYNQIKPQRNLYQHPANKLRTFKDMNGKRKYYEGRIKLMKNNEAVSHLFRVFTDSDLGINKQIQTTLQETYIDDDCQTDSEQIKLAINKSKSQVQYSLKRLKREQLIYRLINKEESEDDDYFMTSQSSYRSKNSNTESSCSFGIKFSKESQFL